MEWFWEQYCRSPVDAHNPFAAPLRAADDLLAGGPPAMVATAGVDHSGTRGGPTRTGWRRASRPRVHEPDLCHGFCSLTGDVPAADRAMDDLCEGLAAHLE